MSNLINRENMEFELNPDRFNYVLDLFRLTKDEFISRLNEGRKREVLNLNELNDILNKKAKIKISLLKNIDKIFEKGLTWYISKRELPGRTGSSIFFRQNEFNSELNLESIKLTNKFEERNFEIQTLCKFINFDAKRKLNKYTTNDNPEKVAVQLLENFQKIENDLLSKKIIKKVKDNDKESLKNLIRIIEEFNIFVFEFVETWNKKEKADFDGFFVKPNMIVLKRQEYLRREIFTLLHEFAHYLLDSEEIDRVREEDLLLTSNGKIERWCDTFTYSFLIGEHSREIDGLDYACEENNFYEDEVDEIYNNTLLSKSAIYIGLRIRNKISQKDYSEKIKSITDSITRKRDKKRLDGIEKREVLKKQGKPTGFSPKPIQSNLFKEIVKINYFQGNIGENELCDFLRIKPDRIGREIY